MRKNLPVTQQAYDFPAHLTLISITDIKGRITYCNDDFINVSGYTKEELLGQPHNILRHPDIPEEAFRDFWTTIQSGAPWSAVIMNRRKDGDGYWVRANATPMRNGDRIVGYLSVRTRPEAAEVETAERLFSIMRGQAERGRLKYRFRGGLIQKTGPIHRVLRALRPGHRGTALWLALLAAAGPVAAALSGLPMWGVLAAGVLTGALAWLGLFRSFIAPLDRVAAVARHLASGDLSEFISVQRFHDMRDLILPINQLALMTRTVIWDVKQFLTNDAHEVARHSQEAIASLSETMRQIDESSRSINDFVQVIESVAFQTNILALNASTEAARAGEHGRGFAVVASEVRALAQRTADAAHEIRHLIEESRARVEQGHQNMEQTRTRMNDVVGAVERQGQILAEIDHATQEQTTGIQEAGQTLHELNQITQKNTQMADGLARLSEKMESNSRASLDNVRVFRLASGDQTHAETDAVALRRTGKAHVQASA